ncbi:TPA: hypothetical protein U0J94_000547 [Streptococcus suis]|uniref:Uncharacterized protein n=1 Tax=Streptococcus suis TaxID=1307 RepID=A0AAP6DW36_STRSU|nr:hypothetical protein [Streptococcus suis]MCB2907702.1 hypothetical protein [Streptococcus suis]MCO0824920.1 hypothetical protein [Streptococcus suis]MCO0827003.1 hypothetical protein [Streptococcus suis]MCO0845632.1 hypothetical protein [Streptococcus suis]MCO0853097.1 hypothetical protein [Streptococcus suis]
MKAEEFWWIYEKCFRRYEGPGFSIHQTLLGGDCGYFMKGVYQDEGDVWKVDETIERSSYPHTRSFDSEEACFLFLYQEAKSNLSYELAFGRLKKR